ncbi:MAG: hypothetical protein JWR58_1702 [Pseudonocardia sp.]|nr:hypothetical protein [Pseudonocardia sp.]
MTGSSRRVSSAPTTTDHTGEQGARGQAVELTLSPPSLASAYSAARDTRQQGVPHSPRSQGRSTEPGITGRRRQGALADLRRVGSHVRASWLGAGRPALPDWCRDRCGRRVLEVVRSGSEGALGLARAAVALTRSGVIHRCAPGPAARDGRQGPGTVATRARPAATCECRHECGHGPDVIMRCRSHRNGTLPTRCAFPAKRRLPCHAVHVELTLFRDGTRRKHLRRGRLEPTPTTPCSPAECRTISAGATPTPAPTSLPLNAANAPASAGTPATLGPTPRRRLIRNGRTYVAIALCDPCPPR